MTSKAEYDCRSPTTKGSLIGINFDRNALLDTFHRCRGYFVADTDEIRPQYQTQDAPDANALFTSSIVRDTGLSVGATINQLDTQVTDLYGLNERAIPWYSDQVLPFNITLSGANEYGAMTAAKILGVEILNEGSGVSIDDAVTWSLRPAEHQNPRARGRRPEKKRERDQPSRAEGRGRGAPTRSPNRTRWCIGFS